MPIYAYRCSTCGHAKDVLQKMSDPVLTACPECGAPTYVKQVTAAGFQLKGSGWYVTDFRGGDKGAPAKSDGAKAEGGSGEGKAESGKAESGKGEGGKSESGKAEAKSDSSTATAKSETVAAPAPAPAAPSSSSSSSDKK